MSQSKRASLLEAVVNTAVGFLLSFALQRALTTAYGLQSTALIDAQFVLWFTLLSVVRGYVLRRFFNRQEVREEEYPSSMLDPR